MVPARRPRRDVPRTPLRTTRRDQFQVRWPAAPLQQHLAAHGAVGRLCRGKLLDEGKRLIEARRLDLDLRDHHNVTGVGLDGERDELPLRGPRHCRRRNPGRPVLQAAGQRPGRLVRAMVPSRDRVTVLRSQRITPVSRTSPCICPSSARSTTGGARARSTISAQPRTAPGTWPGPSSRRTAPPRCATAAPGPGWGRAITGTPALPSQAGSTFPVPLRMVEHRMITGIAAGRSRARGTLLGDRVAAIYDQVLPGDVGGARAGQPGNGGGDLAG